MKKIVWVLALAVLCLLAAGCYTRLVHPGPALVSEAGSRPRHCNDCHGSTDYYYWHYPNHYHSYWRSPYWRSYYYDPWRCNDYWYWKDDDSDVEPVSAPRGVLFQPRTPPEEPSPALPGGGKVKEGDRTPRQPSTPPPKAKEREKKDEDRRLFQPRRPPARKEPEKKEPKKEEKKVKDE
jgi:hypothetical protein